MIRYARLTAGMAALAIVSPAAGQRVNYPGTGPVSYGIARPPEAAAPAASLGALPHGAQVDAQRGAAGRTDPQPASTHRAGARPPLVGSPLHHYPRVAQRGGAAALPTPQELLGPEGPVTPGPMSADGFDEAPAAAPAAEPTPTPAAAPPQPAYPSTSPPPSVGHGLGPVTGHGGYGPGLNAPVGYAGDAAVMRGGVAAHGCSVCPAPPAALSCQAVAATRPRRQAFLGLYGLYLGRDNPGKATSAFLVDNPPAGDYYPQPGEDVLFATSEADVDFTGGGEVRLGTTFGLATDPCTGCQYQPFAWEFGYWGIAEDASSSTITDSFGGGDRLYGAIDYTGLEYDRDGAGVTYGYRPLNDYYDYQMPIDSTSTNDVRVLAVTVRQTFYAQNLELNFWRFGPGGLGAGASACGLGNCALGGCSGGHCLAGGCGPCDGGRVARPRRFFLNGLAGVRYLRLDETLRNGVFFTLDDGGGAVVTGEPDTFPGVMPDDDNTIIHDVEVDNDLLGFQLGCGMSYLVGCRCSLFCDTNLGVYNNHIEQSQRVYSPGGGVVRFAGSGGAASVRTEKNDVALLGEIRAGLGYRVTPRCRLTAAYRLIGISGVALAVEQIGTPVNAAAFGHIDSNDSLVLHGFQGGLELKY